MSDMGTSDGDVMVPLSVATAMTAVGSAAKRDRALILIVGTAFFVMSTVVVVLVAIVSGSLSRVADSSDRSSTAVESLTGSVKSLTSANATQASRLEQQGRFLDAVNDLLLCGTDKACIDKALGELRAARSSAPPSATTPGPAPATTAPAAGTAIVGGIIRIPRTATTRAPTATTVPAAATTTTARTTTTTATLRPSSTRRAVLPILPFPCILPGILC